MVLPPHKKWIAAAFLFSFVFLLASALLIPQTYFYVIGIHTSIFFFALYFLYRRDAVSTLKKLGIPGNIQKNTMYAMAGLVAVVLAMLLLNALFYAAGLDDSQNIAATVGQLPLYMLLFGILIAPVTEELFFRALLVEKIGILGSSILFALSHVAYQSISEIIGAFVIGLLFAYLYRKSGSLVPIMAIHFIFNLISIAVIYNRF